MGNRRVGCGNKWRIGRLLNYFFFCNEWRLRPKVVILKCRSCWQEGGQHVLDCPICDRGVQWWLWMGIYYVVGKAYLL
jgi:hypothetical protein